uniref:Fungal lipase-type domain-containing protein n=1 Tax=Leersia perrieri TaxID=77586 RepID=A0A0D9X4B1_9ORYZ
MSTAAAASPATSLLRPATLTTTNNRVHLNNLEHLFRNRGSATIETAPPPQPAAKKQATAAPLLRLPSFLGRGRSDEHHQNVSPRRLERVLLPAAADGPSPRGNIAATWRDLHGEGQWRGLLDPLHPDLRREIVRYGEFVDAAYSAFLSHPDASPADSAVTVNTTSTYRVTAPLFATSSVTLPSWVASASPCAAQRTSLVGYVAVCESPSELRRMGRRDIVVALRGTCTVLEWAENIRADLVPAVAAGENTIASGQNAGGTTPKVECGFWNLYKTRAGAAAASLSESVVSEIRRLIAKYDGEELSITITGHSLGAALAILIADELSAGIPNPPPIAVFSFGGPRVGDVAFAERVERGGARVLRVVNAHDVVPRFPPRRSYADVGSELRLDSRASPYLRPDADVACCHDLEAYIHLVDGFLGSHCPFRANAKRSILRLLQNQGGNVKQLYIRKALDMRARLDAGDMSVSSASPLGRRRRAGVEVTA